MIKPKFVLIDQKTGNRNDLESGNFKASNFQLSIKGDKVMLLKPRGEIEVFINSFHFPEDQEYQVLKNGDFIEAGTEVFKVEFSEPVLDSESATLPADAAASHANSKSVYVPRIRQEVDPRNINSISDFTPLEARSSKWWADKPSEAKKKRVPRFLVFIILGCILYGLYFISQKFLHH